MGKGRGARNRRNDVAEPDLQDAFRVGLDCITDTRRQLLLAIIQGEDVDKVQMSRSVRERQLEELEALALTENNGGWTRTQKVAAPLDAPRLTGLSRPTATP